MKQLSAFVIDDQQENIYMFEEMLRIAHYASASALDGLEAINWLELNPAPNLIVLDVNLPQVDGLSVYRYIRGKEKFDNSCVIIATANSYMLQKIQLELLDTDYVFLKPVNLAELHAIARKISKQVV